MHDKKEVLPYKITETTIAELRAQPEGVNTRKHNPRNIGMIADSMQEVGAARSVVIDENNDAMAGSGSIEAYAQAGMERVLIVDTDGETLVAVRRSGLNKTQKLKLALADNRTQETSEWDTDVLKEYLAEDKDAFAGLWNDNETDRMLDTQSNLDSNALWQGLPEFVQFDAFGVKRLIVHFQTVEDYEAFAVLVGQKLSKTTRFIWFPQRDESEFNNYKIEDAPAATSTSTEAS